MSDACHRSTTSAYRCPTTELVVINSSVPRGIGPYARVRKRKDNYYALPRSPESPTLRILQGRTAASSLGKSRGLHVSCENDYILTTSNVHELEVDPFVIRTAFPACPPLPICSPTFPDIHVKTMNIRKAPMFSPSDTFTSSFSQMLSLDLLPALGLPEDKFWKLFSRCKVCRNFMTTRTVPYHVCPGADAAENVGTESGHKKYFLTLLDAHNVGHEAGVPEGIFRAIFFTCGRCGRYMTKRVSVNHYEDSEDCDSHAERAACISLGARIMEGLV